MSTTQDVMKAGKSAVMSIQELMGELTNSDSTSLSQRARAAAAISRVYITDDLAGEDIMLPLLGMLNQMYIAYLMTSLGLEQSIGGAKTVADITRRFATESMRDATEMAQSVFDDPEATASLEANSGTIQLTDSEQHLISGKVIEMEFVVGDQRVPVRMFVQLVPRLIDPSIGAAFVDSTTGVSSSSRWKQAKAGEIRMFRDFVLAMDRINAHSKALKNDSSGDLAEMVERQNNGLVKHWLRKMGGKVNYNTASSVLVISKNTLDQAMQTAGTRFDSKSRAKMFASSYMMMVCVVDTAYNTVELYANGIPDGGEYSFQEVEKVGAAKKGGMDLKDVMAVFGRGGVSTRM